MTRRDDTPTIEQNTGVDERKTPIPQKKQSLINTWLSQLEERIAKDFYKRTGLDYKETVAQIIDAADPFPGMQVLDVPTGTGIIARQFVGRVGEKGVITGVDESREIIERARLAAQSAKLSLRVQWKCMSLDKLSFPENSFDLVTCVTAFHKLNQEKFLREAHRILKPGGILLIADELAPELPPGKMIESLRRTFVRYIKRDNKEAEATFPATEEMMDMLLEVGFSKYMFRALRQRNKHDRIFSLIKSVK